MCIEADRDSLELETPKRRAASRKKLSQLPSSFHCSIIGTCLSLEELRGLCRKMRITLQNSVTDYDLHRSFVGLCAEHSHAARRLHKHLDQKYRAIIRRFAKLRSDSAIAALWEEAVASGELTGAYWALATHPYASDTLRDRVYGEVHMLSHLAGAAARVDAREFSRLHRSTKTLTEQLADVETKAKAEIRERDVAIHDLRGRLRQAQAAKRDLDVARERLEVLQSEPLTRCLQSQVEACAAELEGERARAERAETESKQWKRMVCESGDRQVHLEGEFAQLQAERDALEQTLERLLAPECGSCAEQDECLSDVNLCGRCILYVGGRSRQCAHFRALVERQNGSFMHHDGGLHDGRIRLGSVLPQADAVLCPLDCVSHDAANRVKQFCKRHGKRLVLMPRSSLAAFARGLHEVAA